MGARSLPLYRVKRLLHLVGEVRELGSSTEAAREHLATGLIREAGATIGAVVLDHGYDPSARSGVKMATLAGFDGETLPAFAVHEVHGTGFNPVHRAIMGQAANLNDVVTYRNDNLFTKPEWEKTRWIAEYVRPARLAHFIGSIRWVGPGKVEGLGFMRAIGERAFSDEERDVVRLVHATAGRLYADDAPALAPRVRQTFERLLTGAPDKEIANDLGLSLHTVRQYVKTVFKAYRVNSRSELIVKYLRSAASGD